MKIIMFGFYRRIITVDLSRKAFSIETLPDGIYSQYLGGKGLATHLLIERNPKGVDPLQRNSRSNLMPAPKEVIPTL
jgi:aldehyde:ferredoxin oxidoreductase